MNHCPFCHHPLLSATSLESPEKPPISELDDSETYAVACTHCYAGFLIEFKLARKPQYEGEELEDRKNKNR